MSRTNHFRLAGILLDLACVLVALTVGGVWGSVDSAQADLGLIPAVAYVLTFLCVWQLVSSRLGLGLIPVQRNQPLVLRRVAESWATTWGVGGLLSVSLFEHPGVDVWTVLAIGFGLLLGYRILLSASPLALANARPRTMVVGACASARALSAGKAQETMDFIGFVPFPGEESVEMAHLPRLAASTENLQVTLRDQRVDLALVSPSDRAITGDVHRVFRTCDELGLGIQYFPSFLDLEHLRVGMAWNDARPGLSMSTLPNQSLTQLVKRTIDVVGASIGVATLLPVFLACAAAVKLTSKGPVFFRQIRVGKNGETFHCLKFRTMFVGAHAEQEKLRAASTQDGPAFKIPKDPRITGVGRVLRKFSLDELPQLLNVLVGDMSLVGPRPPIPTEVDKYTWWQRRRISVKPGLTCVWQVWGRNRVSFKRWVEMDLYYIDNWSLWLDLKLIVHTVRVVLRGTGM